MAIFWAAAQEILLSLAALLNDLRSLRLPSFMLLIKKNEFQIIKKNSFRLLLLAGFDHTITQKGSKRQNGRAASAALPPGYFLLSPLTTWGRTHIPCPFHTSTEATSHIAAGSPASPATGKAPIWACCSGVRILRTSKRCLMAFSCNWDFRALISSVWPEFFLDPDPFGARAPAFRAACS